MFCDFYKLSQQSGEDHAMDRAWLEYPAFRRLGYDCGSGPTESQCGMLAHRLKCSGMRWDPENAEAMMGLAALYHSDLWQTYWKIESAAA